MRLPNGDELVPDGFDELWDVVWQVHQEQAAHERDPDEPSASSPA